MLSPVRVGSDGLDVSSFHTSSYVRVNVRGHASAHDLIAVLRRLTDDCVHWDTGTLVLDVRALARPLSFADQFLLGTELSRLPESLERVALLVAADRVTHVTERAVQESGALVRIFRSEEDALDWAIGL